MLQDDTGNWVQVGRISGVYGVKGWVKVYSYTDPVDNILDYKNWYLQKNGQWTATNILQCKKHGKGIIAHISGCNTPEDAARLKNIEIGISRDQLPELDDDEYYWSDLVGLSVATITGDKLGEVSRLMSTGSNDVLVVKGQRERLIPYIRPDVVKTVDLDKRIIEVDWDPEF